MSTAVKRGQEVLAKFLLGISHEKGWWFRLPQLKKEITSDEASKDKDNKKNHPDDAEFITDAVMPQFGTVFGLTENAAAVFLELIGCVEINKSNLTRIRRQGWEDLCAICDVGKFVEPEFSRLGNTSAWYIRLGTLLKGWKNPFQIWNKYKKN